MHTYIHMQKHKAHANMHSQARTYIHAEQSHTWKQPQQSYSPTEFKVSSFAAPKLSCSQMHCNLFFSTFSGRNSCNCTPGKHEIAECTRGCVHVLAVMLTRMHQFAYQDMQRFFSVSCMHALTRITATAHAWRES